MDFTVSRKQTRTLMNIKSEKQHFFRKQYPFYDRSKWNEHKRIYQFVNSHEHSMVCLCYHVLAKQFLPSVHYEDK